MLSDLRPSDPSTLDPGVPPELPRPEPSRKRHGCLFWGCLTVFVIGGSFLGFVGYVAYHLYNLTSSEPAPVPVAKPAPAEVEGIQKRVDAFAKAEGTPAKVEISPEDINSLIAGTPEGKRYAGKVFFRAEGDGIVADVSIPLSELRVERLKDRYLNGTLRFKLAEKDGAPVISIEDATAHGEQLPSWFLSQLRDRNLLEIGPKENVPSLLSGLKRLSVKDGKIVLER
jgi:hypothetical protein